MKLPNRKICGILASAACGTAVALFCLFRYWIYAAGLNGTPLPGDACIVRALSFLASQPAALFLSLFGINDVSSTAGIAAHFCVTLMFYSAAACFLYFLPGWTCVFIRKAKARGRLGICSVSAAAVILILLAAAVLGLRCDVGRYRVTALHYGLRGLPHELEGLKAVFFSDIHIGMFAKDSDVDRAASMINELKPDIILGGGDYVYVPQSSLKRASSWMGRLRAGVGFWGVLGNHDNWQNRAETSAALEAGGLKLIDNRRIFISADRTVSDSEPKRGLCIGGVGDLWSDRVDFKAAAPAPGSPVPSVILCHNPDAAVDLRADLAKVRTDLILSGHTHGGQIALPSGVPLGRSNKYWNFLLRGWWLGGICPVYVTSGLGETVVPMRCGVVPEIVFIVFHSLSESRKSGPMEGEDIFR